MFAEVSLGGEYDVTEAALGNRLLLVLVLATDFPDVLLEVRQPAKRVATLRASERAQVVVSRTHVHCQGGVVTECQPTPENKQTNEAR